MEDKKRLFSSLTNKHQATEITTKKPKYSTAIFDATKKLPDEMTIHIANYLTGKELLALSEVNTHWRRITQAVYEQKMRALHFKACSVAKITFFATQTTLAATLEKILSLLKKAKFMGEEILTDNLVVKVKDHYLSFIPQSEEAPHLYGQALNWALQSSSVLPLSLCQQLVHYFMAHQIDINFRGPEGQTLLHFFCDLPQGLQANMLDGVTYLIKQGANILLEDKKGLKPLTLLVETLAEKVEAQQMELRTIFNNKGIHSIPLKLLDIILTYTNPAQVIEELLSFANTGNNYLNVMQESLSYLNNHLNQSINHLFKEKLAVYSELEKIIDQNTHRVKYT